MKNLLRCLCGMMLALALLPAVASAQSSGWSQLDTRSFAILYAPNDRATAEQYAGFVDAIYDEMAAIFGHHAATPLTLRLYPDWESYVAVNPLARNYQGIVAHADYQRHEVVVIISQTARQNETEIENNIRHEMTHIIASDLSEDRLSVMFQEAIAQYVEHAAPELETRVLLLQRAYDANQLMRWSGLDDRDRFYNNSQISYPESLSIAAFLIENYTFATFRDFLTTSANTSGFRSALEQTYGASVDELEQAWRAWLPQYLAGGYKRNAVTAYDLSRAEQLLSEGRYAEATTELEGALSWLRTTDQQAVLAQAEALLERSHFGQQALAQAADARSALDSADYARAIELTSQAQRTYANLGDTSQDAVLAEYMARANRGLDAIAGLTQAQQLANSLRYPQARDAADRALGEFIALGDEQRVAEARQLRASMDGRQSLLGAILLAIGCGGILGSLWRRFQVREAEAW